MLVPSNSPLPTNSQTPISAQRIARGKAYLARIDQSEKLARFGVLGFCAPPKSYSGLGFNVMSDVFQTPQVPIPNNTTSSLVSNSGSGVLDTSPNLSPPSPQVVPINGSGDGVGNDPEYGPLTLQTRRPANVMCPPDSTRYRNAADSGDAPDWGSSFNVLPLPQTPSGFMDWIKAHPLLSGALVLGGLALASQGKTQRNRGRR